MADPTNAGSFPVTIVADWAEASTSQTFTSSFFVPTTASGVTSLQQLTPGVPSPKPQTGSYTPEKQDTAASGNRYVYSQTGTSAVFVTVIGDGGPNMVSLKSLKPTLNDPNGLSASQSFSVVLTTSNKKVTVTFPSASFGS
jgi:hypothetical protein